MVILDYLVDLSVVVLGGLILTTFVVVGNMVIRGSRWNGKRQLLLQMKGYVSDMTFRSDKLTFREKRLWDELMQEGYTVGLTKNWFLRLMRNIWGERYFVGSLREKDDPSMGKVTFIRNQKEAEEAQREWEAVTRGEG